VGEAQRACRGWHQDLKRTGQGKVIKEFKGDERKGLKSQRKADRAMQGIMGIKGDILTGGYTGGKKFTGKWDNKYQGNWGWGLDQGGMESSEETPSKERKKKS